MYLLEDTIRENQNFNGGGLATEITGKFESNRNALAKLDENKRTAGQVAASLRRQGHKVYAKDVKVFCEEWHHAGYNPNTKSMGIVYYTLKSDEEILSDLIEAKEEEIKKEELKKKKEAFINKWCEKFERVEEYPDHAVVTQREMKGKYGLI